VDDDRLVGACDRRDRAGELPAEVVEEAAVRLVHRPPLAHRLDGVAVDGETPDVDRNGIRGVVRHLPVGAEIDRDPHAVGGDRVPAGRSQVADPVGANDDAERRLAAAAERQSAEVADVDAPVPAKRTLYGALVPSRP
jgi:hypothetical protein